MSVIAKMYSSGRYPMGSVMMHTFSCVGDNEFMSHYTPSNEDILFSKYSPSGDARVTLPAEFGVMNGDQFYFLFTKGEAPSVEHSLGRHKIRISSITDFGGTSRQVQIESDRETEREDNHTIMQFSYRIMIDNPRAFDQFKAGERGWWVTIYAANRVTKDEAIAMAHAKAEADVQA